MQFIYNHHLMGVGCWPIDKVDEAVVEFYIWIDQNINNYENNDYAKRLKKKYLNVNCFNNIKDALECLKGIKFNLTYIIVSGSLFSEFIIEIISILIITPPNFLLSKIILKVSAFSASKDCSICFLDITWPSLSK